jgi:hypothetical protein
MLAFYDQYEDPIAYVEESSQAIYTFPGEPVAWIHDEGVYAYSGQFLGWFRNGWIWDHQGLAVFFSENSTGGPVRPVRGVRPVRDVRQVRPVKGVREVRPVRPAPQLDWSNLSGVQFFD